MAGPVMCEVKRCGQRAAHVRFYDARKDEHRFCVWCAIERKAVHEDRHDEDHQRTGETA